MGKKEDKPVEAMPDGPDDIVFDDDATVVDEKSKQQAKPDIEKEVMGEVTEDSSALSKELEKAKNDYLYLRAEYDNYRKQAIKERSDLLKYAGERLAFDLLDTLDIFETALAGEVSDTNVKNFIEGIELTAQQLRATLEKHGITPVKSEGEVFNPELHEALSSEETDKVPAGHISRVFKKPYKYHDKLLRPGQVVVAKEKK